MSARSKAVLCVLAGTIVLAGLGRRVGRCGEAAAKPAAKPAAKVAAKAPAKAPTRAESIQKWRAMRFGLFVHWGPVSLKGTEIGWSRGNEIPVGVYDNLYKQFNPVKFNANEWVSLAMASGMK